MSTENGSAVYDDFAWFYYRYWNEGFHRSAFPILSRILLPHLRPGFRVLDVCCGTGYLARLLADRGFAVAGVDASAEMIRYAREHEPRAQFHVADVRDFRAPGRFHAAVSTFDSLNHILDPAELAQVFRNVRAALEPPALFAFDMLQEDAYLTHWGESSVLVEDDHLLAITGGWFDHRTKFAHCRVTMFRRMEEWRRADMTVVERAYTHEEIGQALASAGFGEVNCYAAADLGMEGDLGAGRIFFTAAGQQL